MADGQHRRRLTPTDLHAMLIPVPEDDTIQDKIADAEAENRVESRKGKEKVDEDWTAVKQRFGDDLVEQ